MGLDGKAKMSKSLDNYIGMTDSPETVKKKLGPAFTDPARKRRNDPGNPDICNIFTLHKLFSPEDTVATVNTECRRAPSSSPRDKRLASNPARSHRA